MRISYFSSLFSAITVLLYPLTNVMKILRSLAIERTTQKSSLISEEKVSKEVTNSMLNSLKTSFFPSMSFLSFSALLPMKQLFWGEACLLTVGAFLLTVP